MSHKHCGSAERWMLAVVLTLAGSSGTFEVSADGVGGMELLGNVAPAGHEEGITAIPDLGSSDRKKHEMLERLRLACEKWAAGLVNGTAKEFLPEIESALKAVRNGAWSELHDAKRLQQVDPLEAEGHLRGCEPLPPLPGGPAEPTTPTPMANRRLRLDLEPLRGVLVQRPQPHDLDARTSS